MQIELEQTTLRRLRAAIYARVSSSKQHEERTIESQITTQITTLVDYAEKNDLEIPEGWIFQDQDISGSSFQRPGLDSLRDLITSGGPDVVLIYHPDRLARKYVYQVLLLDEFKKCGVRVVFANNTKNAETPEEHLLEQFQGVFAEYERAQIAERCRRGRLHKARAGSVTVLSNAPYGYRYVKDQLSGLARYELCQEEAETVLLLFQMYGNEGKGIHALQAYMNQSGKKTRRSLLGWDRQTIRNMLRNRTYTGLAGFGKTEKCVSDSQRVVRLKKGRVQTSNSIRRGCQEENWITIHVPVIVSEELYQIVQERLKGAQHFASRNTKVPSILQGMLVCGKCRGSYYKKSRKNAHTYYSCHNTLKKTETQCNNRSVRQQDLDDYVWEWIITMLRNPELVIAEIQRRAIEDPDSQRIADRGMNLLREQNKLITSRNKLLDAYTEGACLSLEELKKRMNVLNQQMQQVERELSVIKTQETDEKRIKQHLLTLEKFMDSLNRSSEVLSVTEKQHVVRALIDEVVIGEESIKIRHCIPMNADANSGFQKCPLRKQRST